MLSIIKIIEIKVSKYFPIFLKNDIDSHTRTPLNYKMENVFFEKKINETDFNIEKLFKFTSITSKN